MKTEIKNMTQRNAAQIIAERFPGEINNEPSLTVQGLSEPMSTILDRFQRGQTVLGKKLYYDSEVNENFENEVPFKESEYDLTDLDKARELHHRATEEIQETKRRKAKEQKLIDDEKLADEVIARRASNPSIKDVETTDEP